MWKCGAFMCVTRSDTCARGHCAQYVCVCVDSGTGMRGQYASVARTSTVAALEDLTVAPMTNAYPVLAMAHRTASRKNREKAAFLKLHKDR